VAKKGGQKIVVPIVDNRIKNKKLKIARHQKKHPNDAQEIGTIPNYNNKKLHK